MDADNRPPPTCSDSASARKLKKRELDRKAQRLSRERTRNRIAYLESVVADYQQNDGKGTLAALTEQLAGVTKEKDCLEAVLTSIERSLQTRRRPDADVIRASDASAASFLTRPVASGRPETASSPTTDEGLSSPEADMTSPLGPRALARDVVQVPRPSSPCDCSRDGSVSLWRMANEILLTPCPMTAEERRIEAATTEDTAVRVTTMGWDSVGELSPIWKILREIDNVCFSLAAQPATKLAMLLVFHRMLRWYLFREREDYKKLPAWYLPRPSQAMPHEPAIDFFPWPGVRERLVFNSHRYCSNQFWRLLGSGLRFLWPGDLHDAYTFSPTDNCFSVTPQFRTHMADVNTLTLMSDMFHYFPELSIDMPAFQAVPPHLAPRAKDVAAGLLAKLTDVYDERSGETDEPARGGGTMCLSRRGAVSATKVESRALASQPSVESKWPGRYALEYVPTPYAFEAPYDEPPRFSTELGAAPMHHTYGMQTNCLDMAPGVLTDLDLTNIGLSTPLHPEGP